jgi:hypothetical protein
MKRFFTYLILPVLALAASCAKTEPVDFAHEKQAFKTLSDKILLEVIMPQASASTDEIYIVGAFNGGEAAIGNASYLMTHSETITSKWGIYLDPAQFQGGKTLADGFTFYNVEQGYERSSRNEAVSHKLTIGAGQWANVYADKWEKYFLPVDPEEGKIVLPEHDGVRIYIIDQTGWDAIALYQWGDVNNFGGDWPGAQVAGTWTANGQEYKYFEYSDEIFGLSQNLIFNNNNNGTQLADYNVTFAEGVQDYFFLVTADGVSEAPNPAEGGAVVIPDHDGVRVWVDDQTGWDAIALYQWGDVNNFGGDWPGAQVAGSETLAGIEYKYFEYGDDIFGLAQNLIFNNNGGGTQLADYNITFEEGVKDYFFQVTADGATLLDGPGGGGGVDPGPGPEPQPEQPKENVVVFVQDLSGWDELALYTWGDKNVDGKDLCGDWPGIAPAGTQKVGTVIYKVFELKDALGRSENLIFNNNGAGSQTGDLALILEEVQFVQLADDGAGNIVATVIDPTQADIRIYIHNKTDWEEIALYAYGDAEAFGGWPGATPINVETIGDVNYLVFGLTADMAGKKLNLIVNNNGGGQQLEDFAITVPEDEIFLTINASYSLGPVDGNPRGADKKRVAIFVDDQTSWGAIALYQWGNVNNLGGGWPGAQPGGIITIGETDYKVFFYEDALGLSQSLIFNNNGGGIQLADYALKFEQNEYFLTVTDTGVTPIDNPTASVVFVDDQTGWDDITLYMWGDVNNLGGGWPGIPVSGTATVNEINTKAFVVMDAIGNAENLIFNNNGGGTQLADYALKYERNAYYLKVTATGVNVF